MTSGDEIRGQEPAMTTREMVKEIYSWAVVEKSADLPTRVTEMEKWQNRVIGGVGVIVALDLMDRIAVFLAPRVHEVSAAIAAVMGAP